ncbi:AbrB/MazE/SpoVT family DNA-binding domain-containing protein [Microbacterium sp. p3-SID336]|uniref:AbrB/MazE/SpoVT family DNA-binding domain-containing protein n=1 Tax=Microbacterium sp. p3-SID336 TaxID=2916212 RepID=UPI0021A43DA6|nr:AbrB/MazE/SpoVT family DNA-binding domain-containing protein [Microbacterium sp. p3-SID336]MCT1478602.1 AbrB/MazE/SpoVT family DNA-binding domain-containing protein [Microbacterium sp. p3-SID336]
MHTTMDKAGRVVIPAALRERIGLVPGPIDMVIDGNGIRIEVQPPDNVVEKDGRLVITGGPTLTADDIRELRLADQR